LMRDAICADLLARPNQVPSGTRRLGTRWLQRSAGTFARHSLKQRRARLELSGTWHSSQLFVRVIGITTDNDSPALKSASSDVISRASPSRQPVNAKRGVNSAQFIEVAAIACFISQ
jgi:hypothetical protein